MTQADRSETGRCPTCGMPLMPDGACPLNGLVREARELVLDEVERLRRETGRVQGFAGGLSVTGKPAR